MVSYQSRGEFEYNKQFLTKKKPLNFIWDQFQGKWQGPLPIKKN